MRRVLSLCLLLALVILLMRQAADPANVQRAFQTLGVPLDAKPGSEAPNSNTHSQADASTTLARSSLENSTFGSDSRGLSKWDATCADVIPRILDSLTADQLRDLATFWFARVELATIATAPQEREPAAEVTNPASSPSEWVERGRDVVAQLIEQTGQSPMEADEKLQWLAELEQVSSQWQELCMTAATEELSMSVSQELRQVLTTELDHRLVASLRDASPWTKTESLAFWRLLQRTAASVGDSQSHLRESTAAPLVDTRQLDAEADALRGQRIRFRGRVHRAERVDREFAPLYMNGGYWVLWLRGEDDALQPVAVYTTDPGAAELASRVDARDGDYPPLEVHAIFAKRLAYASENGLQVGPAMMASRLIALSGPPPTTQVASPQSLGSRFRIAVMAACLLAAAILLPIVWGSGRRAKRKNRTSALILFFASTACWQASGSTANRFAWSAPPFQAAESATVQQATSPPWGKSNSNPLTDFLTRSGQIPLTETEANELRTALSDRSAPFPDSLLKIINSIERLGWKQAVGASQAGPANAIDLGEGLRLEARRFAGWVRAANPVELTEAQSDWFQLDDRARLYQVELQVQAPDEAVSDLAEDRAAAERPELMTIFCERVPQVWLSSAQLRQPAQLAALELVDQKAAGEPVLCGLAAAPQWLLPKKVSSDQLAAELAPPLAPYALELGQLGWDLTYLDVVAEHNQQPLSRDEADGFYSMLRLANAQSATSGKQPQVDAGEVSSGVVGLAEDRRTTVASQPLALLADAKNSVGMPIEWLVRVVSGTLVEVDQPADQRQLGGKAYIQFDGFVDIGNDRIRFQPVGGSEATPALDFSGEFPVTIVAPLRQQQWNRRLVPVKQLDVGKQSWTVGQYATLQGRFYRLWSYQSELVQSSAPQGRQVAPLVIASELVLTAPPASEQTAFVGWFGWALSVAMLVILGSILWLASRPRSQK